MMTAAMMEILPEQSEAEQSGSRDHSNRFDEWFPRCRKTLHDTACLILGNPEMAARAVQSSWAKAHRNPPGFQTEGPFRSWILRILIREALSIFCQIHPRDCEDRPVPESRQQSGRAMNRREA
jgi:DNA-directed RNA polymerase specialized sigma24 family protein